MADGDAARDATRPGAALIGRRALLLTLDLTCIVGYYTFLAMQLNAAQYGPPAGAKVLVRFPEAPR